MERTEKALLALPLLALAVWRLVRAMQFGSRLHRARGAVPAAWPLGIPKNGEQPPGSPAASVKGSSTAVRAAAVAGTAVVWIVGNVIL